MTSILLSILFLISVVFCVEEQQSFRSILIERACQKRPELQFCGPSSPAVPPSSVVPLILPPLTTPSTTTATTTPPHSTSSGTSGATTDSVDFEELEAELASNETVSEASNKEHELLGSLVKLPKPEKTNTEKVVDHVIKESGALEDSKNTTSVQIEDEKGVLVFVSEYCVVERERFVRSCHGEVDKKEETFCKTYVSACASTTGVLPVMTYCARYYTYYPVHCKAQLVDPKALQFCFAFEQFCLPEKTAAQSPQKPKSSLRKCEDVLPEARKVCNPFPNPKDTFNLLRCTHFLTNCKKFVDWL